MKQKSQPPDRYAARALARCVRLIPRPIRIRYVRTVRRSPRTLLLILAFTASGAFAVKLPILYALAADSQRAALNSLQMGFVANAVRFEAVVFGALFLAAMTAFIIAAGTDGLKFVGQPTIAVRRSIRRKLFWSMACAVGSYAMLPVASIAGVFDDAHMQRSQAGTHAMVVAQGLRPATAARILEDEDRGVWYATDRDGPSALEIKQQLRDGLPGQRATVRAVLHEVAKPGGHHVRAPIE